MTDESRKAFEAWVFKTGCKGDCAREAWSARDAEVGKWKVRLDALGIHADELAAALKEAQAENEGLKARVAELEADDEPPVYRDVMPSVILKAKLLGTVPARKLVIEDDDEGEQR